jgi:hypothetical protein
MRSKTLKIGHVEGDDHRPDDAAEERDHQRLDEGGEALRRRLDLLVVEVADLREHLVERAGVLHRPAIIWTTIAGKHRVVGERPGAAPPLPHAVLDGADRLAHHRVAAGLGDDVERTCRIGTPAARIVPRLRVRREIAILRNRSPKIGAAA